MLQPSGNPEGIGINTERRGWIVSTPDSLPGGNDFDYPECGVCCCYSFLPSNVCVCVRACVVIWKGPLPSAFIPVDQSQPSCYSALFNTCLGVSSKSRNSCHSDLACLYVRLFHNDELMSGVTYYQLLWTMNRRGEGG
jgi:hypothetical protein